MGYGRFDYLNYLRQHQLSVGHRFHPVFEAVENGFNAIDELKPPRCGLVRIVVRRLNEQKLLDLPEDARVSATPSAITGFDVIDNGIGITQQHWDAFETVYTKYKAKVGGKGVGRLSYLQAFERAEVESRFIDGVAKTRRFSVVRSENGTVNESVSVDEEHSEATGTTVRLMEMEPRLRDKTAKRLDAIAAEFVKHFFKRLSMPGGTRCVIEDEWDGQKIDLRQFCNDRFVLASEVEPIKINGHQFSVTHTRCRTRVASRHEVLLCAKERVVRPVDLPLSCTTTRAALKVDGSQFFYVAFVSGDILNQKVSDDRLGFSLPERDAPESEEVGMLFPLNEQLPSLEAIAAKVAESAQKFLQSVLDPLREAHRTRIEAFCKRNVVFRPILKHRREKLMNIPVGLPDEEFERAVWNVYHEWKSDIRSRFKKMAETVRLNAAALVEYRTRYSEILRDLSEMAFHELADYVTDRRAVIDFLDDRLKQSKNGKFQDEDAVHDIFFPRKQTSDDVGWDESNLWLIDERLAYQQFVASDIEWSRHGMSDSESKDRPDIAVYYDKFFDATFAFAGGDRPFTSVTLIEFKKPERTQYTDTQNPVFQVLKYIREIRASKALTNSGHTFRVGPESPIHVYIICHMVEELRPYVEPHNPIESPNSEGFIFHLGPQNALVQFVSFEKIISDAMKRNEVFFRKLGIDA